MPDASPRPLRLRLPRVTRAAVLASVALPVAPLAAQTVKADSALERCHAPLGTIAIDELEAQTLSYLRQFQLQSPTTLIRMLVQKSNCFVVVERGRALANMRQERAIGRDGELQGGSNVGAGQMKAADFILTPTILFSEGNAGGAGVALGGLGRKLGIGGAAAGGVKFKEAATSMLVVDTRSGVQVAAAEGNARKSNFALGGVALAGIGLAGGGYGNTNEGKLIAASYLDNWNQVVRDVRDNEELARMAATAKTGLDGRAVKAGATFNEGDVVAPKIAGVKLLGLPKDAGRVIASLKASDELIVLGPEENEFLKVQSSDSEGWVKKSLVLKRR